MLEIAGGIILAVVLIATWRIWVPIAAVVAFIGMALALFGMIFLIIGSA